MNLENLENCFYCEEDSALRYEEATEYKFLECLNDDCAARTMAVHKPSNSTRLQSFKQCERDEPLYREMLSNVGNMCEKFGLTSAMCAVFSAIAEGHALHCVEQDRKNRL